MMYIDKEAMWISIGVSTLMLSAIAFTLFMEGCTTLGKDAEYKLHCNECQVDIQFNKDYNKLEVKGL